MPADQELVNAVEDLCRSGFMRRDERRGYYEMLLQACEAYDKRSVLDKISDIGFRFKSRELDVRYPKSFLLSAIKNDCERKANDEPEDKPPTRTEADVMAEEEKEFNEAPSAWQEIFDSPFWGPRGKTFKWAEPGSPSIHPGLPAAYHEHTFKSVHDEAKSARVSMHSLCEKYGVNYTDLIQAD